ncbi:hypothetical protein Poli38472_013279 [Pythium oligandrum]|uniref:Uncharacterized protein n=1 Tax=Pythium oligandrum TaxID=41045 RepID=A0A8K1C2X2_PYTOL|nr:hypothetical protein Poli38472_013279 [Pythium oligandrum]|eukprot:TMW55388.1 hypothetical protein Poli38472_013279 [Pythium oligandrum]
MSFADFAGSSNDPTGVAADRQVSIAKSKLEQLQRQVIALKRSVSDKNSSGNAINDDDLRERIHFASQLHEELPKAIAMIPEDATYSFVKRKLCKDFRILTRQWADVMQGVDRTKEPKDKVEDIFKRAEDEYRKALAKIMRGEDPEERDAEASSYEVTEY